MKYQTRSNSTTEWSFSGNSAGFANRSAASAGTVLGLPTAVLLARKQCGVCQPQCCIRGNRAGFANRSAPSAGTEPDLPTRVLLPFGTVLDLSTPVLLPPEQCWFADLSSASAKTVLSSPTSFLLAPKQCWMCQPQ